MNMDNVRGAGTAAASRTEGQPVRVLEPDRLPWAITWCLLAALFLLLVWYPASKLSAQYSFGSNEGFSAYLQAATANGEKIYGSPPVYRYANYPPLSFHLVGWLSAITHDVNLTGRWLSFFAYLGIGGLIALIVKR